MLKGATIWARQIMDSDIFFYKPDKWFKIWFFIVSQVNHQDGKLFKRGEGLITYEQIMARTRASKAQVEKCIKYLEKEDMIESRRTTRGRVRFVLNYNKYQVLDNYKEELEKSREKTYGRVGEELEKVPIDKNERMKECKKGERVKITTSKKILINGEDREALIGELTARYPHFNSSAELDKFISYWTEENSRGEQRWEGEEYFDIRRRLTAWFGKIRGHDQSTGGLAIFNPNEI